MVRVKTRLVVFSHWLFEAQVLLLVGLATVIGLWSMVADWITGGATTCLCRARS